MHTRPAQSRPAPIRRAIALVETIIAMLLITFVLVSTIQIVAPLARTSTVHADRLVAANLASELAEEIATKAFAEAGAGDTDYLGPGVDERPDNRLDFDDVDDYHGWSASPPRNSKNEPYTNLAGWTRSVNIAHADPANPAVESPTYTGVKRVTISVHKNATLLEQITTLHTDAADTLGFLVQAP